MKTDKELLQLAARAVGFNVKAISVDVDDNFDGLIVGEKNTKQKVWWNPMLNDGDALRLAVDLMIRIRVYRNCVDAESFDSGLFTEAIENDKHAATRRAIVLAAAAIGEKLRNAVPSCQPCGEFQQCWDK